MYVIIVSFINLILLWSQDVYRYIINISNNNQLPPLDNMIVIQL